MIGRNFVADFNDCTDKIGQDALRELRRQRQAEASRTGRNGGRADRANAVSAGLQTRGKGERRVVRSQHDGHDVRVASRGIEAVSLQLIPQKGAESRRGACVRLSASAARRIPAET